MYSIVRANPWMQLSQVCLLGRYDIFGVRSVATSPDGSAHVVCVTDTVSTSANKARLKSASKKLVLTLVGCNSLADVVLQCAVSYHCFEDSLVGMVDEFSNCAAFWQIHFTEPLSWQKWQKSYGLIASYILISQNKSDPFSLAVTPFENTLVNRRVWEKQNLYWIFIEYSWMFMQLHARRYVVTLLLMTRVVLCGNHYHSLLWVCCHDHHCIDLILFLGMCPTSVFLFLPLRATCFIMIAVAFNKKEILGNFDESCNKMHCWLFKVFWGWLPSNFRMCPLTIHGWRMDFSLSVYVCLCMLLGISSTSMAQRQQPGLLSNMIPSRKLLSKLWYLKPKRDSANSRISQMHRCFCDFTVSLSNG